MHESQHPGVRAAVQRHGHPFIIQPCLEIAIQKQLVADKVTERNFKNEKLAVLGIIAAIKQAKMAAIVKCESTGTPGCGSLEDENELDLDADADAKRSDVEQQRANGSRDW